MLTVAGPQVRSTDGMSRRGLLQLGGLALAKLTLAASVIPAAEPPRPRLPPEEVKERIRGPILTVPTPFTAEFAIDETGVRRMVELGLGAEVGVYELTAGNSQYAVLSEEEIRQLTRVVVDAVGGRGIVIAATGPWWTGQAVDFVQFAESAGADALQVILPPGSEAGYVRHFRTIAAASKIPLVLQGELSLSLLEKLVELPTIVAMKEDGSDAYYAEVTKKFGRRLAIFCGGQKKRVFSIKSDS